jgi:hypothetical protein
MKPAAEPHERSCHGATPVEAAFTKQAGPTNRYGLIDP